MKKHHPIIFGPVSSRRLGQSLGIVNVQPKNCSYNCVYCQLGKTNRASLQRIEYFSPEIIYEAVVGRLSKISKKDVSIDYCTFVPLGEPTLDKNIGKTIGLLSALNIKQAVITNGSLLQFPRVRYDLLKADTVSVKVDTVINEIWERMNRPHPDLNLEDVLSGILKFSREFRGELITETMLVDGLNQDEHSVDMLIDFLSELNPRSIFVTIPTRPPAEEWVHTPEWSLNAIYQQMRLKLPNVKLLVNNTGAKVTYNDHSFIENFLNTITIHPMEEKDVKLMFDKAHVSWSLISELMQKKMINRVRYKRREFFVRRTNQARKMLAEKQPIT
jgi:wyosine [tRNA(Phe)-imidazoG37] synthetase (radical SAM superfamily)